MTSYEIYAPVLSSVLVLGVGWLIRRSIDQIDRKLDRAAEDVSALSHRVTGYEQLAQYQERRITKLEAEKAVLEEKLTGLDRYFTILSAMGRLPDLDKAA